MGQSSCYGQKPNNNCKHELHCFLFLKKYLLLLVSNQAKTPSGESPTPEMA